MKKTGNSHRMQKIEKEVQSLLGQYLTRNLANSKAGFVSVTKLVCSKDVQQAKVYISSFNAEISEEEIIKIMNENRVEMQAYIASHLKTKFVPKLQFFMDDTIKENIRIMGILDGLGYTERPKE